MLKLQPNPKLMLDSKTHSKHLRALNEVCRILVPHVAFGCTSYAAEKNWHPALDLSHSNPDFCHPKNAGKKIRFRKNSGKSQKH
jgi:hypothetical protein